MTAGKFELDVRTLACGALNALAGGALLALLLTGMLLSFAAGYSLPVDTAALGQAALGLSVLLTLALSLPRLRWAAFGALTAGWAVLLWRSWTELLAALRVLLETICEQIGLMSAALTFLPDGAADGTTAAAALILFTFPWAALLGWCVLRGHSPVLALLLTWPLLLPAFVLNAPLDWTALLLLLTGTLAFLCAARSGRSDPVGGAKLTLLLLPLVALALSALTVLSPEGAYQFPDWAASAQLRLLSWVASLPNPWVEGDGVGAARPAQLSETVDLTEAGAPSYSGAAVLEIESERTGMVYLRGYSMGEYTGTGWTALPESAYEEPLPWAGPGGLGESASWDDLLAAYPPALYPAAAQTEAEGEEITVRDLSALTQWVYTPYQLTGTGTATAAGDTHLARDGGQWQHRFDVQPADFAGLSALTGETAQAEQLYQVFVNEHYLSLPEGLAEALVPWTDLVRSAYQTDAVSSLPRRYQQTLSTARAVAEMLEDTAVYDLDVPALPEGEDAALWFLEGSGCGYCMHFATAGTVLLRAMGIPARYAAGYAVPVAAAGTVQVPDSAAHAWVEIYLEGYGWYPVEMTPAEGLPTGMESEEAPAQGEENAPEAQEETPPEQEEPSPDLPEEEPQTPEEETPSTGPGGTGVAEGESGGAFDLAGLLAAVGRALAAALLAAGLLLGGRYLRRALLARRFAPLHQGDANGCVIALYALLEDLSRWGGQMPEEAVRLAQKARFSQHAMTPEELSGMRALFRAERRRTEQALPRWKRAVFRLFWHEM